jgi:hypothetical protein
MDIQSEIRCRLLLEYIRLENEAAAMETSRGGWLSAHDDAISDYGKMIEEILEANN